MAPNMAPTSTLTASSARRPGLRIGAMPRSAPVPCGTRGSRRATAQYSTAPAASRPEITTSAWAALPRAISAASTSGPPMKQSSCAVASMANTRARRASDSSGVIRPRVSAPSGGSAAPASVARPSSAITGSVSAPATRPIRPRPQSGAPTRNTRGAPNRSARRPISGAVIDRPTT